MLQDSCRELHMTGEGGRQNTPQKTLPGCCAGAHLDVFSGAQLRLVHVYLLQQLVQLVGKLRACGQQQRTHVQTCRQLLCLGKALRLHAVPVSTHRAPAPRRYNR